MNEDAESDDEDSAVGRISDTKKLSQVFKHCASAIVTLDKNNPNWESCSAYKYNLNASLASYCKC
jgi:hypothetical protein